MVEQSLHLKSSLILRDNSTEADETENKISSLERCYAENVMHSVEEIRKTSQSNDLWVYTGGGVKGQQVDRADLWDSGKQQNGQQL